MKKVKIYCDGSSLGNPGKGGWGVVLIYEEKNKLINGSDNLATNNQMELKAAIEGIKAIKEKCEIEVFTDSQYVVKGMNEWRENWIKNNWQNSKKKPIENLDLWKELIEKSSNHNIKFTWVKGHANDEYNNLADKLANEAASGKLIN